MKNRLTLMEVAVIVVVVGLIFLGCLAVIDHLKGHMKTTQVVVVQEVQKTPAFEVVSYKVYSKNFGKLTEPKKLMGTWGLEYGSSTLYYTYDTEVVLGVRDPGAITMTREGDVVSIDSSSIEVEVLSMKAENYKMIGFDTSNALVPRTISIDAIFESHLTDRNVAVEVALVDENVAAAKQSFMDNYEVLCRQVGLEVNWN